MKRDAHIKLKRNQLNQTELNDAKCNQTLNVMHLQCKTVAVARRARDREREKGKKEIEREKGEKEMKRGKGERERK